MSECSNCGGDHDKGDLEFCGIINGEEIEIPGILKALLIKQLAKARKELLEAGDQSYTEEDPLHRIASRIAFAMAKDQEDGEKILGEAENPSRLFTDGRLRWLSEPDMHMAVMIMLGVQMAMLDAETMVSLVSDLGLEDPHFMEFAVHQIGHILEHQKECEKAIAKVQPLNTNDILGDVSNILGHEREVEPE